MQVVLSNWNIVVVGAWNVGIFDPAWVSHHAFGGAVVNLQMQLQGAIPVVRFQHGRAGLTIYPDRLTGTVVDSSADAVTEASAALRRILTELRHTPVNAVGLNFGFREAQPGEELLAYFALADNERLVQAGAELGECAIRRTVQIQGSKLNITEKLEADASVKFDFNFHYDVAGAAAAAEVLEQHALPRRQLAIDLMRDVYHLEIEEQ